MGTSHRIENKFTAFLEQMRQVLLSNLVLFNMHVHSSIVSIVSIYACGQEVGARMTRKFVKRSTFFPFDSLLINNES